MELEAELGHDPEVPTATAQRPEQVRIRVLARGDERAVGEDDVGTDEVVDRQPPPARQVAHSASERQPADTGRRNRPERRSEPEAVRRVVDVAKHRAAADARQSLHRVDVDVSDRRQVDLQGTVDRRLSRPAVRTAAHRDIEPLAARERKGLDDIRGVAATGDQRRPPVDHAVVNKPRVGVRRILRADRGPANTGAECGCERSLSLCRLHPSSHVD